MSIKKELINSDDIYDGEEIIDSDLDNKKISTNEFKDSIDINGDGEITQMEQNITEDKFKNRRKMAWVSMISMTVYTAILLTPAIDIDRIKSLENILDMFYIAMASIVGAYMGFATWANKK